MLSHVRRSLPFISVALLYLAALPARAEEPGPDAGPYGLELGAGLASRPAYEGASESRLRAIPLVRAHYNSDYGRFGLGANGLSWAVRPVQDLELGLSVGRNKGRKASLSQDLDGLGDVKGGTEVGAFGSYRFGALEFRVGA